MLLSTGYGSYAQYDTPVAYMSYFSAQEEELAKDYLGYMSAVTHSHNGRKMVMAALFHITLEPLSGGR